MLQILNLFIFNGITKDVVIACPWSNYFDNILGPLLTWGTIPNNRLWLKNGLIKEFFLCTFHNIYRLDTISTYDCIGTSGKKFSKPPWEGFVIYQKNCHHCHQCHVGWHPSIYRRFLCRCRISLLYITYGSPNIEKILNSST